MCLLCLSTLRRASPILVLPILLLVAPDAIAQPVIHEIRVSNTDGPAFGFEEPIDVSVPVFLALEFGWLNDPVEINVTCTIAVASTSKQIGQAHFERVSVCGLDQQVWTPIEIDWPSTAMTISCLHDDGSASAGRVATLEPEQFVIGLTHTAEPPIPDDEDLCRTELRARGFAEDVLLHCVDVCWACGRELLGRTNDPSTLPQCRDVVEPCALQLLAHGWDPSLLGMCIGVAPRCAELVLVQGFSPGDLRYCRWVRDACAVKRLTQGTMPSDLPESDCAIL